MRSLIPLYIVRTVFYRNFSDKSYRTTCTIHAFVYMPIRSSYKSRPQQSQYPGVLCLPPHQKAYIVIILLLPCATGEFISCKLSTFLRQQCALCAGLPACADSSMLDKSKRDNKCSGMYTWYVLMSYSNICSAPGKPIGLRSRFWNNFSLCTIVQSERILCTECQEQYVGLRRPNVRLFSHISEGGNGTSRCLMLFLQKCGVYKQAVVWGGRLTGFWREFDMLVPVIRLFKLFC